MSVNQPITVRIVRDINHSDGWIAKTAKGKVCFLDNLNHKIHQVQAGDRWTAKIVREQPNFLAINLTDKLA